MRPEARRLFHKMFEESSDAAYLMDPSDDRILEANRAGCELLGYTRDELLAATVSDIHPAEMPELPAKVRQSDPWCLRAQELACSRQYKVIHLIYQDKEWEGLAKDYEFSPQSMQEHWSSGRLDIEQTLAHPDWLRRPPEGVEFATHDQHRSGRA